MWVHSTIKTMGTWILASCVARLQRIPSGGTSLSRWGCHSRTHVSMGAGGGVFSEIAVDMNVDEIV